MVSKFILLGAFADMIKAILFDMDGTVLDTEKILKRMLARSAEDLEIVFDLETDFPFMLGRGPIEIEAYYKRKYGEDFPIREMVAHRWELSDAYIEEHGIPYKKGAPEVFFDLRSMGIKTAIATSCEASRLALYMKFCPLDKQVDEIVTLKEVKRTKPAPDIFLLAAKRLGVDPTECAVVEDAESGILAAHAAGMIPIFVPDLGPKTPVFADKIGMELADLSELIPTLKASKLL